VRESRKPRAASQVHPVGPVRVLGYVSSDAGARDALNEIFERQAKQIAAVCRRRRLSLVGVIREREPRRGRALDRPGLGYALELLSAGEASGLVVDEPFRLAPSLSELGGVLDLLLGANVRFLAATPQLDTQERAGRLAIDAIIAISHREHQRLALRTRKGMIAAREKGPPRVADYPDLEQRIGRMRARGLTLQAIADQLNAEGVPTMRGGAKWRPSSVQVAAGYHRPSTGKLTRSFPESQRPGGDDPQSRGESPMVGDDDADVPLSARRVGN
jgi:DNA invertase Pin-like site-specific DNA recombinase